MTAPAHSTTATVRLATELRRHGVALLGCREGRLYAPLAGDWLCDLLASSPMVARAVEQAMPYTVEEALPGLVIASVSGPGLRSRRSRIALVAPTGALVDSEHLVALCQPSSADMEITRRLLGSANLPAADEAERRVALAVRATAAECALAEADATIESMGRQIAENYEELHLLYTTIRGMGSVRQPVRFVRLVCQELLETLPYGWVGAQFGPSESRLKMLAGRLLFAGEPRPAIEDIRGAAARLLAEMDLTMGCVLNDGTENDGPYAALGRTALVWPLTVDGHLLGIIIAGEKEGPDVGASSIDMKLLEATASHTALFLENSSLYDDLKATFLGTLKALTAAIDAKDRYTCGHSERVAHLTAQLASAAGLDERTVERYHIAGLVHDIGKIGVPERVLVKPGKLDDEEFDWIRKHPEIGYTILQDIPQLYDILPAVLHHHERWDGGGYPRGLRGEEIPESARLVALADAFDAMSTTRTYRPCRERSVVLEEITRCGGTQFAPDLARIFVGLDFAEYDAMLAEHLAASNEAEEAA